MSQKEVERLTDRLREDIWSYLDSLGYVNLCDIVCEKIDDLADTIVATLIEEEIPEEDENIDFYPDMDCFGDD